ncbi:benzodiazepine receptor binding [Homalodisca vitripennis]|nr:benzodiazepine receptor binding [Homalodisca vitripennis]
MREASDKRKELEREHTEALTQLREKQNEIQRKLGNTNDKTKAYESIESLQSKIRELEKKAELQNVRHEELMLEMAAIKRTAQNKTERSNNSTAGWKKSGLHQEAQTPPDSVPSTPDYLKMYEVGPESKFCFNLSPLQHCDRSSAHAR